MNHYESRKENFLKKTIDSSELDFVESELQNLKNPSENKIITIKYSCINKFLTSNNKQTIDFQKLKINKSGNNIISFHNKSATINYSKLIKSGYKWKYSFNKKIKYLSYRLNEIWSDNYISLYPIKKGFNSKKKGHKAYS